MGGSSMELRAFQLETSLMVAEKKLSIVWSGLRIYGNKSVCHCAKGNDWSRVSDFPNYYATRSSGCCSVVTFVYCLICYYRKKYKRAYGIYSLYLGVFFFGYFTSLIMTGDRQTFVWFMVLYAVYFRSLQFIKK